MLIDITNENHDEVINTKEPVVIDFYANFCGPCKLMLPKITELANTYEGGVISKCDAEVNRDLVVKYGIKAIPTLIYLLNGKEVHRTTGSKPMLEVSAQLDAMKAANSTESTDDF